MINNFAFAGDVRPDKAGVYLVTTDTPHCFSFFLGWFNGQYWYEYERGTDDARRIARKKTARLAVTAWSHIASSIFVAPMSEQKKASTESSHLAEHRTEKSMWAALRGTGSMHT